MGQTMSNELIPAFEKAFKCKVESDSAFPFLPKLQASSRSAPVYDVLHANSNEQWAALEMGIVEAKIAPSRYRTLPMSIPMPSATRWSASASSPVPSALACAPDKGYGKGLVLDGPSGTAAYDGASRGYVIPVNALSQAYPDDERRALWQGHDRS